MITLFTEEQKALLPVFRQEWLSIGTNTDRVDFGDAEKEISSLYVWGGLEKPKTFIHLSSPMMCQLFLNFIINTDQISNQLRGQLRDQLGDQLRGQLGDQLRGQLRDQLGGQIWGHLVNQLGDQLRGQIKGQLRDQIWGQLRDQLGDQLRGQLRDQLRDQIRGQIKGQLRDQMGSSLMDQLGDQLWDQLRDQIWGQIRGHLANQLWGQLGKSEYVETWFCGQQDSYWISFYEFTRIIGVDYDNKSNVGLDIWKNIARSCHWFYPFSEFCVLSDKPKEIHFDINNRLHNDDGKAIVYSDGWGVSAIHGVRVPDFVVDNPEMITIDIIDSEPNSEVRRIMMSRFGWNRYLQHKKAILVNKDYEPTIGELYQFEDVDGVNIKIVRVQNGTPEQDKDGNWFYNWYFLRTYTEAISALDGVRWTYPDCRGMTDEEYREWNSSRT